MADKTNALKPEWQRIADANRVADRAEARRRADEHWGRDCAADAAWVAFVDWFNGEIGGGDPM